MSQTRIGEIVDIEHSPYGVTKLISCEPPQESFFLSFGVAYIQLLNRIKSNSEIFIPYRKVLDRIFQSFQTSEQLTYSSESFESLSEVIRTLRDSGTKGFNNYFSTYLASSPEPIATSFRAIYFLSNPDSPSSLSHINPIKENPSQLQSFLSFLRVNLSLISDGVHTIKASQASWPIVVLADSASGYSIVLTEIMEKIDSEDLPAIPELLNILKNEGCQALCPDCKTPCTQQVGHQHLHSSHQHRKPFNWVRLDQEIEDPPDQIIVKRAIPFIPVPLNSCQLNCIQKGRGHTHPILCKPSQCLVKNGQGYHFSPEGETQKLQYDMIECKSYWNYYGWQSAVPQGHEGHQEFQLCNFICLHPEHQADLGPVYCKAPVHHSVSSKYYDHKFWCDHVSCRNYDIVFIIDSTGSMGASFPKVKESVIEIIGNWSEVTATKFAIVAYTDHGPDNAHYPPDHPIDVFPKSQDLEDGEIDGAITFIEGLNANGGGGAYGEAMIDGIQAANSLGFRPGSKRVYILLADDSPHGKEFLNGTGHPNGCPCGYDWRELISAMRDQNVDFIFVVLADIVKETSRLFNEEFGGGIKIITMLNGLKEFTQTVCQEVSVIIEQNLELINY